MRIMGLAVVLAAAAPAHAETRFEANAGQWNPLVRFVARQGHATWFVTDHDATVALHGKRDAVVHLALVGAQPAAVAGEGELTAKSNYFVGDRSRWRTGVANYERVRAHEQVPGVDVVWYGGAGGLEYDLEVAAGVDARTLAFEVAGARGLRVARDGSLQIDTAAGPLVEQTPRVVQNGHELIAHYQIDRGRVRFAIDGYDPAAPVVIDPLVKYATFLGGTASETLGGVAVDAAGNAYVTGGTSSTDFPKTTGTAYGGQEDAFVTKIAPDGATAVYSTYIGGSNVDEGIAIAVDAAGHAFVSGGTASTNFPATAGAYQTTERGTGDTFVAELSPAGDSLVYATYLGGNGAGDFAAAIAIDSAGNAYVTGRTFSATWPTTPNAFLTTICDSGGTSPECAYVTKVAAGGASLAYSTFLGAIDGTQGWGIAVDAGGNAYVTGNVTVTANAAGHFPTTTGAFQTGSAAGVRGFLTKLAPDGKSLVYSTYLHSIGANLQDTFSGVAVDSAGNAYVAGTTTSTTWVTTAGAYQTTSAGQNEVIVAKLDPAGASLVYSTYLGGTNPDIAQAIAIDGDGNAYVTGYTGSRDFPTTADAPQRTFASTNNQVFATKLDASGATLGWSTFLGGTASAQPFGIAVGPHGAVYIAGVTGAAYPTTAGAFQPLFGGGQDGFVTKLIGGHNADGCAVAADCISGICVDGVCCDAACADQCEACDVAGSVGTCTPVTGAPHGNRTACVTVCACDGTDTAKCTNNGNECDIGVCSDDHTLHNPDGTVSDCTPFKCAASGTCATSCANVDDCVAPNICSPDGQCIPLPPQVTPGGCGCGTAPAGWSVWWIGIVGYALLRRRRR